MPRPIIIDTDPGQDDAVAILLALASPELEVKAITTVAGNVPLPLTTENALRVVELANRTEVAVYAGCPRPMLRPLLTAEHVHGKSGLDGSDLPPAKIAARAQHAVAFLIEALAQAPEPITLVPIGPLTNIALALVARPAIQANIREIVLMGGAWKTGGNTSPAAEFNILVDPHAADVVFRAGIPIVMMPLDVTHQNLTTPERLERIRAIGTKLAQTVANMLAFYDRHDIEKYGMPGGPLHDPTTIAYLLKPDLFGGKKVHVAIETADTPAQGTTIVDWWGKTKAEPNALFVNAIDSDGFYRLLLQRLARL